MRIESLTFFRFIAAAIVVIFHYGRGTALAKLAPGFLTAGPEMVSFFFVLSGFVLMIAYWDRDLDTKKFLRARFARIVPIYYLALIAVLFLEGADFEKRAILLNVSFLQSWFPPYPLSINIPAWALSVELFFYVSFPIVIRMLKTTSLHPLKLLGAAFSFWLFTQVILINLYNSSFYQPFPSISHDLIFYFPLSHLSAFLFGIAGGYFYLRGTKKVFNNTWILTFGFLAICVAVFYTISNRNVFIRLFDAKIPFAAGSFAPLFILLILFAAYAQKTTLLGWLSNRLFGLLGSASYIIYIFQLPFKQFMDVYVFPDLNLSNNDASFYIYFIALVLFSVLVFHLVEKPVQQLLTK
jgi:peptidoglycan/LPS O-acetylase OafA/YrhL